MADETPNNSVLAASGTPPPNGFYESSQKAYERVGAEFDYWTGKLNDTSLQMCYALIGANWVVFGSVGKILKNNWSKLSLLMVFVTLGCNLAGAWWASARHKAILDRADKNFPAWEGEYEAAKGKDPDWPFTRTMVFIGTALRWLKGVFPLVGAILLLIGAVLDS